MTFKVTAKDVFLSKPVLGYHGTWEKLKALVPREVKGLDSIGTWVTLSPKAARMYGPNVHQVIVPGGKYLRAHSDDFYRMFVNIPLVDKHFSKEDAKIIKSGFLGAPPNVDWKRRFSPAFRSGSGAAYMGDWRKLIQGAGYNGVIWARSWIDLQKEDKPHTVILVFEHEPMRTILMKTKHAGIAQGTTMPTLRDQVIRLAHDNPGPVRDALLPILKQAVSGDPHVQARKLVEGQRAFFQVFDRHLKALHKGFQDGEKQIKGLDRMGSGTIEAPAVLKENIYSPLKDLANYVNLALKHTKGTLNQTDHRVATVDARDDLPPIS